MCTEWRVPFDRVDLVYTDVSQMKMTFYDASGREVYRCTLRPSGSRMIRIPPARDCFPGEITFFSVAFHHPQWETVF